MICMNDPSLAPEDTCTGCAACAAVCRFGAISMDRDAEGFLRPKIDSKKCRVCGRCSLACPVLHPVSPARKPRHVFAAMANDDAVRLASSSGGMFSLLSRNVLSHGGVIFGASWGKPHRAVSLTLQKASTETELSHLRGSKYVQSDSGNAFSDAAKELAEGSRVLFSGTPCQIAGLKGFLGRDYDNLLAVEVICHGCASPAVFESYVTRLEKDHGGRCTELLFRAKTAGWTTDCVEGRFSNGKTYFPGRGSDRYFQGFVNDLFNRPSCAHCPFRDLKSGADISLGDFWHVSQHLSGMNDGKGTSLVLCNTEKGELAFREIGNLAKIRETSYALAVRVNPALRRSPRPHRNRERFFQAWRNGADFSTVVDGLLKRTPIDNLSRLCRRFLYRARGKFITMFRGAGT